MVLTFDSVQTITEITIMLIKERRILERAEGPNKQISNYETTFILICKVKNSISHHLNATYKGNNQRPCMKNFLSSGRCEEIFNS